MNEMQTTSFEQVLSEFSLIVMEQGEIKRYRLGFPEKLTIGRATPVSNPDIPLSSPIAGRSHGEFFVIGNQLFYCDKGSKNGTFYNGRKIKQGIKKQTNPIMLSSGDVLRIDYQDLSRPDPRGVWMLITSNAIQGEWSVISLTDREETIIGRNSVSCDIVLPRSYISNKHALITYLNGNYYVSDCGSMNGTWLNGKQIEKATLLREKDCFSICDFHFIFTGDSLVYNSKETSCKEPQHIELNHNQLVTEQQVILRADIREKVVPSSRGGKAIPLLKNIKFDLYQGEMVAILGVSGAGKSTLMDCLNGNEQEGVSGTIRLKGEDLYKNYGRLKCLISSAPQRNIINDLLPVEEELRHAALIRLPGDTSKQEIQDRVDSVLSFLRLEEKRKTKIAKLSGGEQKRVNLGIELVADREILCMDEPMANLDVSTIQHILQILHQFAHKDNKCVLTVIHEASLIGLFDRVIILTKANNVGRLSFVGTPTEAKQYFNVDSFDKIYSLLEENPERYVKEV